MTPFVTINGHSYIRESLPLMRPHIAGKFVAEFIGGLGASNPSLAVAHPARSEVGAVTPGVPEGRVRAPHLACLSGTSIPIIPAY